MSAKHTPCPIEELDMALARLSDTISCLHILSDVCSECQSALKIDPVFALNFDPLGT